MWFKVGKIILTGALRSTEGMTHCLLALAEELIAGGNVL